MPIANHNGYEMEGALWIRTINMLALKKRYLCEIMESTLETECHNHHLLRY
jgi:hypothetical protein